MTLILLLISCICINEVMSNPLGGSGAEAPEDRNEFVEIFNKGNDTVDIYNWIITDFDSEDYIFPFSILSGDSNTIILPGEFALILDPEYIDSGENYMPYGTPECILLTVGNTTIGNGLTNNDSIALVSPEGETVSTYYHPFNAGNGISVERISPYTEDIPENWGSCKDSSGSTPGLINSIFSLPDFKIDTLFVEKYDINLWLKNNSDTTLSGTVNIFNDENRDRDLEPNELIYSYNLYEISKDSTVIIRFSIVNEDVYLLGLQLLHKTIYRRVRVNKGISNLVINEVMYAPEEASEWIELYNRSIYDFYIDSCWVNKELLPKKIKIPPDEYIVFADDSSQFFAYYGNIPAPLLKVNISLSNNGDSIDILDENGFLIDKCIYNANDAERNYSLEKVSPDICSENFSNWGQSLFQGGTPGSCNSIYAIYKPEQTNLLVTPEHFTPNGDGIDENCVISFELPYIRNDVTIRIYDRMGHLLKEKSGFYGGERGEWIWTGRDNKDDIVKTGLYIIFLSIRDIDRNISSFRKTVVSVGK